MAATIAGVQVNGPQMRAIAAISLADLTVAFRLADDTTYTAVERASPRCGWSLSSTRSIARFGASSRTRSLKTYAQVAAG